ncbi:MAG: DUF5606 domain-containing protein [Muribaculaceae bacterium]|nr:DUF5606 domain-containing protein [Muribaculaceae bacterium]
MTLFCHPREFLHNQTKRELKNKNIMLRQILSITGKPGLYKILTQSTKTLLV